MANVCIGTAPDETKILSIVGAFLAMIAIALFVVLAIYLKRRHRRNRIRHLVDPRHTSQIPIAEPMNESSSPKKVTVARRVSRKQISLTTPLPPPEVEAPRDANI